MDLFGFHLRPLVRKRVNENAGGGEKTRQDDTPDMDRSPDGDRIGLLVSFGLDRDGMMSDWNFADGYRTGGVIFRGVPVDDDLGAGRIAVYLELASYHQETKQRYQDYIFHHTSFLEINACVKTLFLLTSTFASQDHHSISIEATLKLARFRAYPKNPFVCKFRCILPGFVKGSKIVLNVAMATLAAILEPFPRHANASKFSPKIIFRIDSKSKAGF